MNKFKPGDIVQCIEPTTIKLNPTGDYGVVGQIYEVVAHETESSILLKGNGIRKEGVIASRFELVTRKETPMTDEQRAKKIRDLAKEFNEVVQEAQNNKMNIVVDTNVAGKVNISSITKKF